MDGLRCVVGLPAMHAADRTSQNAASAVSTHSIPFPWKPTHGSDNTAWFAAFAEGIAKEHRAQVPNLRDIIGNPFRPVIIDPAWRTAGVIEQARTIYDDQAFDRMPQLADTPAQAGCHGADILDHCREPGEHVRGCWVVDLLLGKE
jgi:hypothetical protein